MRLPKFVVAAVLFTAGVAATDAQVGNTPGSGFTTIIGSAMRYVMAYEQKFALLVAEETYVQELQRPPNPGDNLSQRNPGGGMRAESSARTSCWCSWAATAKGGCRSATPSR